MIEGQRLLLYAAGNKNLSQHVVGVATIDKLNRNVATTSSDSPYQMPQPSLILELTRVLVLTQPFDVKSNRRELSFFRLPGHFWYTSLQGGCVPIGQRDWLFFCEATGVKYS